MQNNTPLLNRLTVCIFGRCNSGKSSLFNAITGTTTAIVSSTPGTTTDPVVKAMELLPHGPIVMIDTAGFDDNSALGSQRVSRTLSTINRADFAIYAIDDSNPETVEFELFKAEFVKRNIPFLVVLTKTDLTRQDSNTTQPDGSISVSIYNPDSIIELKRILSDELDKVKSEQPDELLLYGLSYLKTVIAVIPIDGQTPKGRLILPQVQLIRECLDKDIRCNVTTVNTLADAITDSRRVDLVVTDSQAFTQVAAIVPDNIPLTSFSILLARQKGDLNQFVSAVQTTLPTLKDGDKILIAETCTHSTNHEDIGRVKIPRLLEKITNKKLDYTFSAGRDYPANLSQFTLVIHCGGCMISRREILNRILLAREAGVPITNYGVLLAYCNGILGRSIEAFKIKTLETLSPNP